MSQGGSFHCVADRQKLIEQYVKLVQTLGSHVEEMEYEIAMCRSKAELLGNCQSDEVPYVIRELQKAERQYKTALQAYQRYFSRVREFRLSG